MTDDPTFVDLPTLTRELFDDISAVTEREILPGFATLHDEQELPGDRIGWQVDLWETDGDARWRITVEAVGS